MKTKQRILLAAVNLAIIALAFGWHYKPGVRAKITSAYALMAYTTTVPVQLTATGATPITWSVTGGALPPGLSLASDTGIISGTPTLAGTYTFTATATNLVGSDSKAFTIRVNPAGCFVTTTSLPGAVTSTAYSQPLNQSGCTGSWSISSGSLPPGLSLNTTTGVISGTPTGTGTSSFTVTIGSDTQTLSITVAAAGSCAITATSLPGAIDGTSYSQTPTSSNCSGTWAISSGALPPGLSLNSSTGAITGTPTTAGTYSFTVANGSASRPLSILVNASCSITTTAFATGAAGSSYSQALGDVGCSGSWSATGLPSGFSISGSSIVGSPSVPSISTVTIAIGTASKTLTLTIGAGIGGYDGNIDISQMQTRVLSGGTTGSQFLTTTGSKTTGSPLVWDLNGNAITGSGGGGGGSGSLVLLESHTASSSASLVFTSWQSSSYDSYLIQFVNVLPATANADLYIRVSTNGGSTYDSGSNYGDNTIAFRAAGSASQGGGDSGTRFTVSACGAGIGTGTGNTGLSGDYTFQQASSSYAALNGNASFLDGSTDNHYIGVLYAGSYKSATTVNAIEVLASSGNLASGTVRVYGIAH